MIAVAVGRLFAEMAGVKILVLASGNSLATTNLDRFVAFETEA